MDSKETPIKLKQYRACTARHVPVQPLSHRGCPTSCRYHGHPQVAINLTQLLCNKRKRADKTKCRKQPRAADVDNALLWTYDRPHTANFCITPTVPQHLSTVSIPHFTFHIPQLRILQTAESYGVVVSFDICVNYKTENRRINDMHTRYLPSTCADGKIAFNKCNYPSTPTEKIIYAEIHGVVISGT